MVEPLVNPPTPIVRIAVLFEGGLLVVAWGLGLLLDIPFWQQIQLNGSAAAWGIVATLPLLAGLWWSLHSRWAVLADLLRRVEEAIVPLFAGTSTAGLAVVSLLAGVGEEALFRGVLFTWLTQWGGATTALLVTSVLFGLVHFVTSSYAVLAGLIGCYLGGLMLVHDNLLIPMAVHVLYDFVALAYMASQQRRRDRE